MPPVENVEPIITETPSQETIQPDTVRESVTTSETTETQLNNQVPKLDSQQETQYNKQDNSPP